MINSAVLLPSAIRTDGIQGVCKWLHTEIYAFDIGQKWFTKFRLNIRLHKLCKNGRLNATRYSMTFIKTVSHFCFRFLIVWW